MCAWARVILADDLKANRVQEVYFNCAYQTNHQAKNNWNDGTCVSQTRESMRDFAGTSGQNARRILDQAFQGRPEMHESWRKKVFEEYDLNHILALSLLRLPSLRRLSISGASKTGMGYAGGSMWGPFDTLVAGIRKYTGEHPLKLLEVAGKAPRAASILMLKVTGAHMGTRSKSLALAILANSTRWPNIREIIGDRTSEFAVDYDADGLAYFKILKPKTSDVKSIRLRDSKLPSGHLHNLIGSAKALDLFEYDIGATAW